MPYAESVDTHARINNNTFTWFSPLVDSEAPEGMLQIAKQAAFSRCCMIQDAPNLWEDMHRSSAVSDGPVHSSGAGVGTDLVPGLGSTDTCVAQGSPSQT
jgi:hypothetical protein